MKKTVFTILATLFILVMFSTEATTALVAQQQSSAPATPAPSALFLFGTGLIGLARMGLQKKNS